MLDAGRQSKETRMKRPIFHIHQFRVTVSALYCLTGILPFHAQEQKEKEEIHLNMDAVKMIQFDFNGTPDAAPKEAPLSKKWMEFKDITGMPRNMIDTTILWKPTGYFRFEPYTIWTKYGENPVYDKLVSGRPKKQEISWTLNPFANYKEDRKNIPPSPGRAYERATGKAGGPLGAGAVIDGLDFIGFMYNNFTRRGRMLAHNRKHANAWKTYKDYEPTLEDSLKVPNFYPKLVFPVSATAETDSTGHHTSTDTLPPRNTPADTLLPQKAKDKKKPSHPESEGNLYEYIRRKQTEDSIRHQKDILKKDRMRTNPYDLQRQVRRLREMSD